MVSGVFSEGFGGSEERMSTILVSGLAVVGFVGVGFGFGEFGLRRGHVGLETESLKNAS